MTVSELFAASFVHVGGGMPGQRGTLAVTAGVTSETLRGELSLARQQSTHAPETIRATRILLLQRRAAGFPAWAAPGAAPCPEPL